MTRREGVAIYYDINDFPLTFTQHNTYYRKFSELANKVLCRSNVLHYICFVAFVSNKC